MSKLRDELEKSGFKTRLELVTLARNYLTAGGTPQAWHQAMNEAVAAMPGGGQAKFVPHQDQPQHAPTRHPLASGSDQPAPAQQGHCSRVPSVREPIPGNGQCHNVPQDQSSYAIAGEPIPGGGQTIHAQQGYETPAPTRNPIASGKAKEVVAEKPKYGLPPAREPSAAFLQAAAESRRATTKVMLELKTTSAGKVWGSVKPHEFDGMVRDGDLAWAIKEAFGPFNEKQKHMELRAFLPDAVFRKALTLAEVNHVR